MTYGVCGGCRSAIATRTGFYSHLEQSLNVACQEYRRKLEEEAARNIPSSPPSSPEHPELQATESDALGGQDDSGPDESDHHLGHFEEDGPNQGRHSDSTDGSDVQEHIIRALDLEQEESWEPERPAVESESLPQQGTGLDMSEFDAEVDRDLEERWFHGLAHADATPRVVRFSSYHRHSRPGHILRHEQASDIAYRQKISTLSHADGIWAPFTSEVDWRIAKWAKLRGPGSTAFSELLGIEGLPEALNLSYQSITELNNIIDTQLPRRPRFKRHEVVVANESFELYARDIVECLKALWGDPEFLPYLQFEPERHYADDEHKIRMYHDMHTGKWWWATQKRVQEETKKKNITIVPIIISSDKTQLTTFRNKSAYPVYMTIGNLPKHIRRKPSRQGQILVAYLPTSKLEHIANKSARRRATANLFHACMRFILEPLADLGRTGIELTSGDGAVRDCHPILAAYVGDYPEQVLVTCIKTGLCPTCPAPREGIGDPDLVGKPRDIGEILDAIEVLDYSEPRDFNRACKNVGIKPIQSPFWQHLPFLNIYRSITPDLLHQLYQGNIKHLLAWIKQACGEDEIDARCRRLPPNHNIRLFLKGISHLSRVTGTEHDQICRFILAILPGIKLPGNRSSAPLIRATRAMLDFLYLAKYPVHTTDTLALLEKALNEYHDNRWIFVELGIRNDFNFPKDHFINHYRELIELFGTTDNFNTEYSERLHIDLAKNAYRSTNCKDEYAQMTTWLDRRERVLLHDKFINRALLRQTHSIPPPLPPRQPPLVYPRRLKMAQQPTTYGVPLDTIRQEYMAADFENSLKRFVTRIKNPSLTPRQLEEASKAVRLPFRKVSVYHRIKFVTSDPYSATPDADVVVDSVHCEPPSKDKHGKVVPGRFDTAVVNYKNGGRTGVRGYCIAQVRCVFTLPEKALQLWFGEDKSRIPTHLAYVEWFTPFSNLRPAANHRLYKVKRHKVDGQQRVAIVPVSLIRQSVHLVPAFGPVAPVDWKSSNVLEACPEFYVNTFSDRFQYCTLI